MKRTSEREGFCSRREFPMTHRCPNSCAPMPYSVVTGNRRTWRGENGFPARQNNRKQKNFRHFEVLLPFRFVGIHRPVWQWLVSSPSLSLSLPLSSLRYIFLFFFSWLYFHVLIVPAYLAYSGPLHSFMFETLTNSHLYFRLPGVSGHIYSPLKNCHFKSSSIYHERNF